MSSRLVSLLLLALPFSSIAGAPAQSAPRQFISPFNQPLVTVCCVSSIFDIAGGDLDRDGKPDLVVSVSGEDGTYNAPHMKWFKGNGDGTFTEKVIPNALDTVPEYVLLADLNGDGIPDLITTSDGRSGLGGASTAAELDVYLSNGDGTFQTPQRYLQNVAVSTPVVADLRGNGRPDLAVLAGPNIQVMTNNGDGTFAVGQKLAPGASNGFYRVLGAADFNRDGRVDLLIQDATGIRVLTGHGNGTVSFGPSFPLPSGGQLSSSKHPAQILDLNHDGRPDVVLAFTTQVEVLFGNGDGTFHDLGNAEKALQYPVPVSGFNVVIADLNHDGNRDFVVGPYSYLSNGDGTFRPSKFYSVSGETEIGLDVNADGNTDLVWSENPAYFPASLNVALGTASGVFKAPTEAAAPGSGPIVSGDFNRDGIMDVATTCQNGRGLCIFPGTGKGYFAKPTAYPFNPTGSMPANGVATGDINGDGFLDLVATSGSSSRNYKVTVLLGKGDGTFQAPATVPFSATRMGKDALLLDFNKDGKLDLVGEWGVALGNGDGTFQTAKPLPAQLGYSIRDIVAGDFNNDGFLDLALFANTVADSGTYEVHILLGDGSGSFPTDKPYSDPSYFGSMTVADVNKDGKLDLLYGSIDPQSNRGLSVVLGNGDGTFGTPADYLYPSYYCCENGSVTRVADFNLDGNLDAFVTTFHRIEYFRGLPGGKFAAAEEYVIGENSSAPSSASNQYVILDLNGDGFPDIVATDQFFGIMRLLNTGATSPAAGLATKSMR